MTEAKDKKAMSLALGAAFLNHQVEELQKSVSSRPGGSKGFKMDYARAVDPRASRARVQLQPAAPSITIVRNEAKRSSIPRNRSSDRDDKAPLAKDADIVVVDSSLLVHGIGQLKTWCRNGREEIVIVPLEALNTLDLLKKGTSQLAQRARTASRVLEQQVGANPRIRVQRDEAYVPWDDIAFNDSEKGETALLDAINGTPEWLRRTISCARWELEHAKESLAVPSEDPAVVVAVCIESAQVSELSIPNTTLGDASPVPPKQLSSPSKHEQRSSGDLVAEWAKRSGMRVLECKLLPLQNPSSNGPRHGQGHPGHNRNPSSDDEWRKAAAITLPKGGILAHNTSSKPKHGSTRGRNVSDPKRGNVRDVFGPGRPSGGGLVERPAATMTMNGMLQGSKPIRLLTRGQKLDS